MRFFLRDGRQGSDAALAWTEQQQGIELLSFVSSSDAGKSQFTARRTSGLGVPDITLQ